MRIAKRPAGVEDQIEDDLREPARRDLHLRAGFEVEADMGAVAGLRRGESHGGLDGSGDICRLGGIVGAGEGRIEMKLETTMLRKLDPIYGCCLFAGLLRFEVDPKLQVVEVSGPPQN